MRDKKTLNAVPLTGSPKFEYNVNVVFGMFNSVVMFERLCFLRYLLRIGRTGYPTIDMYFDMYLLSFLCSRIRHR